MIAYALRQLAGAWDVMNGRPAGLEKLDLTLEGFWRSFAALLVFLPIDAILLAGDRADRMAEGMAVPPLTPADYLLHLFAGLLALAAFLGVAVLLAHLLDQTRRLIALIVALNWSSPIIGGIGSIPILLFLVGLLPHAVFDWAIIIVGIVVLACLYLVVRTALAVRPPFAIAVLLLVLLIEVPIVSSLDPTW